MRRHYCIICITPHVPNDHGSHMLDFHRLMCYLINKGKLHLDISESVWDRMFKSDEDKKKAETILQTLTGMSIISAKELLDAIMIAERGRMYGHNESNNFQ